MSGRNFFRWVVKVGLCLLVVGGTGSGRAQTDSPDGPGSSGSSPLEPYFTYQGRLQDASGPINGACDLGFSLWDDKIGGSQVGWTTYLAGAQLEDGLFNARLEFGAEAFRGQTRWLEVAVRCPPAVGEYITLSPRFDLTAAPYALYALAAPWSGLVGVPAGFADGVDNDTLYTAGGGLSLSGGEFSVDTVAVQARVAGACAEGSAIRAVNADGTVLCETDSDTTNFWGLTGSSGTNALFNYIGTSDNQGLVLRVNATHALRLEPTNGTPNLVGGFDGNHVTAGVVGAVIAGGGTLSDPNAVSDYFGTVSGGMSNQAGDNAGELFDASFATVGGGYLNSAAGDSSTISGGHMNQTGSTNATIGGGGYNTASGAYSTIPGGYSNTASGNYSFAAGYQAQALHNGAFVWSDTSGEEAVSTEIDQFVVLASNGFLLEAEAGAGQEIEVGEHYRDNAIVAWAKIQSGAVQGSASFGVASVEHGTGSGIYLITLTATGYSAGHLIPVAVAEIDTPPASASSVRIVSIDQINESQFAVYINNGNWALVDSDFVFMATAR